MSVPTSFIYLDKDSVDSLFGQYEPELVPAIIQEEVEQSSEVSGGIHGVLSTDVGQRELNKRITEYRSTPKNSERKLKDLVRFLRDRNLLPMFRDIEPKSEELNKLDDAINLLSQKYDLSTEPQKLHAVRDRLLEGELRVVENQLRDLRGLTFVEGEWSVEIQPNDYFFRRAFVEKVSSSPTCEVRLNKTAINPKHKDVIENAKDKTLRLSVFGTVLVGLSQSSKTVSLNPIAVF